VQAHGELTYCPDCGNEATVASLPCRHCDPGGFRTGLVNLEIEPSEVNDIINKLINEDKALKGGGVMTGEGIPVPCTECVGLQEALDHEAAMAAMFQEALEAVIDDETKRLDLSPFDGEHPIETPAAATAFAALGAYTVASEQFSKRRSLPLPDIDDDDDIPF
jgi:hypothetical protein